VYVVSGGVDRTVRFWDRLTGRLACTLLWHLGAVQTIDWSADGETLATGSCDGTVKLWPWRALVSVRAKPVRGGSKQPLPSRWPSVGEDRPNQDEIQGPKLSTGSQADKAG
jgi:WD40 repeat protein